MPLITEKDAAPLKEHFERTLGGPVTVDVFTEPASAIVVPDREPCEFCAETQELLEDLASLSDHITLNVHDVGADQDLARQNGIEHVPTVVIKGAIQGAVRFVGIPAGYEFATLLEDLVSASRGATSLKEQTRTALRAVTKPVHIQVFVTPSCPYCPRVAKLAHEMAIENANITADVVEISEFPDLAQRYHVHGVPKVVINDAVEFVGAQPEAAFLDAVLRAAA